MNYPLLFYSVLDTEKTIMRENDEEKMAIDQRLGDNTLKHPVSYMGFQTFVQCLVCSISLTLEHENLMIIL